MTKVRFAPAPSGYLHLGNIRTALLNWLFAKKRGGTFLLRLDDTDQERTQDIYADAIQEDLTWLGLTWDQYEKQSLRHSMYQQAMEDLKKKGLLYPCYETAEDLAAEREAKLKQGLPPVYRRKTDAEVKDGQPHWRFALSAKEMVWQDMIRGEVRYHTDHLSDPVLVREDGSFSYMLCSVVDDRDFEITHIIRGEDHVTNTAVQIQLFQALGHGVPTFGHFPLMLDHEGKKFSKRSGSVTVRALREEGLLSLAMLSLLEAVGSQRGPQIVYDVESLTEHFSLQNYGRAAPCVDIQQLWHIHHDLLENMPYDVMQKLAPQVSISKEFWHVIRGNIKTFQDIAAWQKMCTQPLHTPKESPEVLQAALACFPPAPWDEHTWSAWTEEVKKRTGQKGKSLYHPLRLALTGRHDGPQMKDILPFIAPDLAKQRLAGE